MDKIIKKYISKVCKILKIQNINVLYELSKDKLTHIEISPNSTKIFINIRDLDYIEYIILHELIHLKYPCKKEQDIIEITNRYLKEL